MPPQPCYSPNEKANGILSRNGLEETLQTGEPALAG
jgi:hypothetical protein